MALAFPSSPINGQTTVTGGLTWTYNGSAWIPPSSSAPAISHTAIAVGDRKTPSQLTMRVVHEQRSANMLPGSGPHTVLVEEFLNANLFTTRYDPFVDTGAISSETINQGTFTLVGGGSGVDKVYRSLTKLAVPTGVFVATRVEPGTWSGSCYACVGFYEGSGGDFVQAQWRLDTGAITLVAGSGASPVVATSVAGTPDTIAGPTTTTGPLWFGLILSFPSAHAVTSRDGINWDVQTSKNITPPSGGNFRDPTYWNGYRPGFRLVTNASGTVAISSFRAGYSGSMGYRDAKQVTYDDGTPLRRNGRYYFTGTVASGTDSFSGNHMAVYSIDPQTYQTELVRHLFYNLTGTGTGAGYGGQMVYEESTGKWIIIANSWGFDTQTTGVDLIYAESYDDLLSPGTSVLKADRMTGLSSYSLYDSSFRKEDGVWKLLAIETAVRTGWVSGQGPSLWEGTTLDGTMTRIATRVSTPVDGVVWAKIGGSWYAIAGDSTSFVAWDGNLANRVALTSWTSAAPSGLLTFGGFPAHPCTLVVDDGYRTRYLVITYGASLVASMNATRGDLVILEADEKPNGLEFAPRLVPAYMGT